MDEWTGLARYAETFLLVMARIGPPAAALPVALLPRVLLGAASAAWLVGVMGARPSAYPGFWPAMAFNLLLGILMGAGVSVVMSFWSSAGEAFDAFHTPQPSRMEIPGANSEGTAHAALLSLLGAVYFLSVQGPELLILAFGKQLEAILPEAPWLFFAGSDPAGVLVHSVRVLLGAVLALTLPAAFVLLFLEYSMGLLSLVLPSSQPYFLAMPLRSLALETAFLLSIPWILDLLGRLTLWGIQNVMILS